MLKFKFNHTRESDLEKIRKVSGNDKLELSDVAIIGPFIMCNSHEVANGIKLTPDALKQSESEWIGKAIYFRDHEQTTENQIGRIFDSYTVEANGRTELIGMGFGVKTADLSDIFKRIENKIHREMSVGFDVVSWTCSQCNSQIMDKLNICSNGHKRSETNHFVINAIKPDHISFVGDPAFKDAGLMQSVLTFAKTGKGELPDELREGLTQLKLQADDGLEFRKIASEEFAKWLRRANPAISNETASSMASKLSANELIELAQIQKDIFTSKLPSKDGGPQLVKEKTQKEEPANAGKWDAKTVWN